MKSKLAVFVFLFGWFITISYIVYDYNLHGNNRLKHPFIPQTTTERFFHVVILFTFFGTHITGYLINERKKLLVKTLQSEEKLTRILHEWTTTIDSMPYGVMLIDREFNIIRANKYIAELSRVSLRELRFKKCYEVVHKTDKPVDGCPLMKSIEIQSKASFEYYNPCYNKYFIATVTPIFDDKGAVIAYSHSLIDITDTKQKEVKLIESKSAFFNMLKDVDTTYKRLRGLYHDLIIAFANTIDAKSPWTKGHSERVTNYTVSIAKEMGLSENDIDTLRTASFLHDVGKIGTYDRILEKPDKLTEDEFALVKMHTIKGEEILRPIKEFKQLLPVIRSHHEKIDGTGYPDGLKGDEIPLSAKILCVADSYDAMVSDRPYRSSLSRESAISELKDCSGTQFDTRVVKAFLRVLKRKKIDA